MAPVPLQLFEIVARLMGLHCCQDREIKDKPVSGAQRSARPTIGEQTITLGHRTRHVGRACSPLRAGSTHDTAGRKTEQIEYRGSCRGAQRSARPAVWWQTITLGNRTHHVGRASPESSGRAPPLSPCLACALPHQP